MKNEVLLSLYTISMAILCTCEIISIFVFITKKKEDILFQFAEWYHRDVFLHLDPVAFESEWAHNWQIVEHVQESLKCCGIHGSSDFQEMGVVASKE